MVVAAAKGSAAGEAYDVLQPPPVALGISNPLPHLIPPVMPSGSTPDLRLHSNVQTLGFKICNRDSV